MVTRAPGLAFVEIEKVAEFAELTQACDAAPIEEVACSTI
jgi:hypothetical protein